MVLEVVEYFKTSSISSISSDGSKGVRSKGYLNPKRSIIVLVDSKIMP